MFPLGTWGAVTMHVHIVWVLAGIPCFPLGDIYPVHSNIKYYGHSRCILEMPAEEARCSICFTHAHGNFYTVTHMKTNVLQALVKDFNFIQYTHSLLISIFLGMFVYSFNFLKPGYSCFCACANFVYIFCFELNPFCLHNMRYHQY